jgi:hypothetical protein
MSNPLDVAHGFGPDDILFDLFEELQNPDDPLCILCRCEEIDENEGWTAGTALELYLCSHDKYHYER